MGASSSCYRPRRSLKFSLHVPPCPAALRIKKILTAGLKGRGRTQTQGADVTVINQLWTSPASEFVSSSIKWSPAIVQLADITELLEMSTTESSDSFVNGKGLIDMRWL